VGDGGVGEDAPLAQEPPDPAGEGGRDAPARELVDGDHDDEARRLERAHMRSEGESEGGGGEARHAFSRV
jgi:hypothetical protein